MKEARRKSSGYIVRNNHSDIWIERRDDFHIVLREKTRRKGRDTNTE